MEPSTNDDNHTEATPASMSSGGSLPFDEISEASLALIPQPQPQPQPVVMLAPTIRRVSPDRDRTLLTEKEGDQRKPTPETIQGPSKDEGDLEEGQGRELFSESILSPPSGDADDHDKNYNDNDNADADDTDSMIFRKNRKKFLWIGFLVSLLIGFISFNLGYFLLPYKNDDTSTVTVSSIARSSLLSSPTTSPTLSPTLTRAPTPAPSISSAPTATFAPSESPSEGPSAAPTKSPSKAPSPAPTTSPSSQPTGTPSSAPTVSAAPTASPSAAPTRDFVSLIEELLVETYGVEIGTVNSMAIEWLAGEASEPYEIDAKMVQRFALVSIDLSLQGAMNFGDAPRNAQRGVYECGWKGIHCDGDGWVEKIHWNYQPKGRNGSGTISPSLWLLFRSLKVLDLSNNDLVGTIPEAVYKLANLKKLFLFRNRLEGTISNRIGSLDSITHFHLSHNNLSGSIPTAVKSDSAGIRPLEYFNLYSNKLTGTLPENMRLRDCIYFDVGRNKLTGTLPEDVGEKFVSIRHLHLDHNEFEGTLPSVFNDIGNGRLESFSIDHNKLTGTIPGKRDLYNKLVQYTLHVNQFDKMDQDNCRMEVPRGEMVELRADCDVCRCNNGYFGICDKQCYDDKDRQT